MITRYFRSRFPNKEYAALRRRLFLAGLRESRLRRMTPDQRVAVLEKARLDPYDYIFLCF